MSLLPSERRDPHGSVKQVHHEELEDGDEERPSAFSKIMIKQTDSGIQQLHGAGERTQQQQRRRRLQNVPMLFKNTVFEPDNVGCNPGGGPSDPAEAATRYDVITFRNDELILIPHRFRQSCSRPRTCGFSLLITRRTNGKNSVASQRIATEKPT